MKRLLSILAALYLCAAAYAGAPVTVDNTAQRNLETDLNAGSGRNIRFRPGSVMVWENGATMTGDLSAFRAAIGASSAAWADITGKPTTRAGYNITDVPSVTELNSYFANPTGNGGFSASQWRLSLGLGTASTKNVGTASTDVAAGDAPAAAQAYAVQRANHTGTQSADTIVDGTTNKAFTATEKTKLAGLTLNSTVQAYNANLTTFSAIAPTVNVQSFLTAADFAAMRSLLSLSTVAVSGSYTDLSNKPTLGTAAAKNVGTTSADVAAGDDSRIVNAVPNTRTVNGHALSGNVSVTLSDVGGAPALTVGTLGSNTISLGAAPYPIKTLTASTNQTFTYTGGSDTAGRGQIISMVVTAPITVSVSTGGTSTVYRNGSTTALGATAVTFPVGRYKIKFSTEDNGATLLMDDDNFDASNVPVTGTPAHYTPAAANVEAHLAAIDSALSTVSTADPTAVHLDGVNEYNNLTQKTTPTGSDRGMVEDAAASFSKKRVALSDYPVSTATQAALDGKAAKYGEDVQVPVMDFVEVSSMGTNPSSGLQRIFPKTDHIWYVRNSAGVEYAIVLVGGALGTPSSGNLANCTFPTLNQNTTGSAAKLTTARAINGVNFDGTAAVTVPGATATYPEPLIVALSDETTAITTGTAKVTIRAPRAMTLTGVRASLNTASSSGIPTVDIKKNGVSIFSTLLTIDASEKTSVTAATAAVLSTTTFADDDEITFDVTVAGTGAKGLKVALYFY